MLWHISRMRYRESVTEAERRAFEDQLRALADTIPDIALLRVERALNDAEMSAIIVGFSDHEGLRRYLDHPTHRAVVEPAHRLCAELAPFDVVTGDPAGALPRTLPPATAPAGDIGT